MRRKFEFNFWPSFTDLMLSLVLIVLCILGVFAIHKGVGEADIRRAKESAKTIADGIRGNPDKGIKGIVDSDKAIFISEEEYKSGKLEDGKRIPKDKQILGIMGLNRQTITFNEEVLFREGESKLLPKGKTILSALAPLIYDNLDNIKEIQIQGHADTKGYANSIDGDDYSKGKNNLDLGAQRAIVVYKELTLKDNDYGITGEDIVKKKIDPAKHLISISSYGEFKPIDRRAGRDYDRHRLDNANTDEIRGRNRRIEIVIEYKETEDK